MTASLAHYAPWTDRRGMLSALRLVVFVAILVPGIAIFADLIFGPVRPEPYEHALNESGEWAVRLLLLSLFVTPVRRIFSWNKVIGVRRMIGVSVLAYGLLHLGLYMAQENWDLVKVASEIVVRIYLTIGFVALLGLVALGVTSFDRAVRRLGPTWNRLHQLAYPIAVLGILHFFLQSKSDVAQPTVMAGLFVLLMLYRLAARSRL
ncbi:MAG: protein-methionine-sulfoxide reductase heme-binding subunit MsrQ, partial [Roseibium sp.]